MSAADSSVLTDNAVFTETIPNAGPLARCVAVVAIYGASEERKRQELVRTLNQRFGITAVRLLKNKPLLAAVEYVPQQTKLIEVLGVIDRIGCRARQIS